MDELASRRVKAYALDCAGYAALAGATVPMGLLAHSAGWGRRRSFVMAASAVPPILATLLAARQEARSGSTPGKARYALQVTDTHGGGVGFGRSLLRNTVKIAIPWQIGHLATIGAAFGGFERRDPLTISANAVVYPLLGVMTASVLGGTTRALHDRVAGTHVVSA